MKKILFCDCDADLFLDVAINLQQEGVIDPVFWIAHNRFSAIINNKFPDCFFYDSINARAGILLKNIVKELPPVDQELIDELSPQESKIIGGMWGRHDPFDHLPYNKRVELYYKQLRFWLGILNYYRPDIVLFGAPPHVGFDYILYLLCKRKGIQTLFFLHISLEHILLPLESFSVDFSIKHEGENLNSDKEYRELLSIETISHIDRVKSDYHKAVPFYNVQEFERQKKADRKRKLKELFSFIYNPQKKLNNLKKFFGPTIYGKVVAKGKNFEDGITRFEYFNYIRKSNVLKKKLKKYYLNLVENNINLNVPYVYVSLHHQPEYTTCPLGGIFDNQRLMIEIISKAIPKNWVIYIKENPIQFHNDYKIEVKRSKGFYDKILALGNTVFVSLNANPFFLIDNSQVVASVAGTVGWEAVVRGKPAFVFGNAWYKNCEGVFYTPSFEKCKKAVTQIINGYCVDNTAVLSFCHFLEKAGVRGFIQQRFADFAGISKSENINVLTKTIRKYIS